jgi:thymidylate kinase
MQKCIIQDRGISTSLAYQSLPEHGLGMNGVASLTGNKLAMKHRPDVLVLVDISPETAMERLKNRNDKNDDSIFEKLEYLKKLSAQFSSTEFQNFFKTNGTQILHLNGEEKIDIMKAQSINLLKQILK